MRNAIRQWAFDCAWDDLSERQIDDLELLVIGVLNAAPVSAEPCKECDAKQAKIDSLMLEYCPDEITDEQMAEWSANQKPVSECRHCGWLCMPNDSHSKKWYPMQEPVKQEPVSKERILELAKQERVLIPGLIGFQDNLVEFARAIVEEVLQSAAPVQPGKQEPVANYKEALDAWFEKTEWVQKTAKPKELGMHRADVLKQRIHELEKKIASPVSAKREWVDLEPWQLCEIEERIGLPIDSHDFETIGNAYIAAFKGNNK